KLAKVTELGLAGEIVPLRITSVDEHRGTLLIVTAMADGATGQSVGQYSALSFTSSPRDPGAITTTPRTISDLHKFLESSGDDLVPTLRNRLMDWPRQP